MRSTRFVRKAVVAALGGALLAATVASAPAGAATATTTTTVAATCGVAGGGPITITTTMPAIVQRSRSFPIHVAVDVKDFFGIPAPYSGSITNTFRFTADGGTPPTIDATLPPVAF